VLPYTVFRGDGIKLELPPSTGPVTLRIPALGIEGLLTGRVAAAPYFKMQQTGRFALSLGVREGLLTEDRAQAIQLSKTAFRSKRKITRPAPIPMDLARQTYSE
jgi:hypothetical protein